MNWQKALNFMLPVQGQPHQREWYLLVSIFILILNLFMVWSLGLLPKTFGAGFAHAEESRLNTQLILEARLLNIKQAQCVADDKESKAYYTQEIIRLRNLYRTKIGYPYDEPPCSSVIVIPASAARD